MIIGLFSDHGSGRIFGLFRWPGLHYSRARWQQCGAYSFPSSPFGLISQIMPQKQPADKATLKKWGLGYCQQALPADNIPGISFFPAQRAGVRGLDSYGFKTW
jgi:hypothetical protein